jgi:serine/threonine protein kinase
MSRGSTGSTAQVVSGELIAQRYRTIDRLGKGGVGEVLAVFDEATQKSLALKRLLPLTDERVRELLEGTLRREYAIMAQFAHPNVVEVFDFGFDDGRAFYTMGRAHRTGRTVSHTRCHCTLSNSTATTCFRSCSMSWSSRRVSCCALAAVIRCS